MQNDTAEESASGDRPATAGLTPEYTVTISGPGLQITKSIGNDQLLGIMSIALGAGQLPPQGLAQPSSRGASTGLTGGGGGRPTISLREYLIESGARTIPQKMAVLAAYSKEHLSREMIGRDEFKQLFQRASEPVPKNLPRDLRVALDQGWLAEAHDDPSQLYLTGTGQTAVSQGFGGNGNQTRRTARRRRRTVAKSKASSAEHSEE